MLFCCCGCCLFSCYVFCCCLLCVVAAVVVVVVLFSFFLYFLFFSLFCFFCFHVNEADEESEKEEGEKRESNKKSKKKRWSNGDEAEKQNRETKKGRTQTNHRTRKLEQRSSMVGLTQTKQNINFSSFVVFLILFLPSFFIPYLYFHFFPLFCFKVKEAKLFVFCCLAFVVWAMSKGKIKQSPLFYSVFVCIVVFTGF